MGQAVALHCNCRRRTGSVKTDMAQNKASPMPNVRVVFAVRLWAAVCLPQFN
jgi:hypothetical protein